MIMFFVFQGFVNSGYGVNGIAHVSMNVVNYPPSPFPPHTHRQTHTYAGQTQTCTDHAVKELDILVKNFYEKNNVSQKR